MSADPRRFSHMTLLLVTVAFMSAAWTVFNALLPDFLHNQLGVEGDIRGMLEFPRELPGFLMVVTLGLLAGLPKSRALVVAFAFSIVGLVGMGYLATSVAVFIPFMFLWSTGSHI
ncbi:hypothetical protein JW921_10335 [Candidatus Fermentibacterales bacterium]|nr:hypothetical protein [Candidatus Fermentibacterales bacterium]